MPPPASCGAWAHHLQLNPALRGHGPELPLVTAGRNTHLAGPNSRPVTTTPIPRLVTTSLIPHPASLSPTPPLVTTTPIPHPATVDPAPPPPPPGTGPNSRPASPTPTPPPKDPPCP
ncbi:hypothetical protein ACKI1Y_42540, partial [Streptomyces acidiscabies]